MAENTVAEENKELYHAIAPFVSSLPDFRPQETLRKMTMKGEEPPPQDNWRLILTELEALRREGAEGE